MTDHEMLELLVREFTGMKTELSGMKTEISGMKTELSGMKTEISGMKTEFSGMKTEISGMKTDISGIKTEIKEIKGEVQEVKSDVKLVKSQMSEHGEMIQSLIYARETQKAQHDALQMEVAKLSGEMRQGFTDLTEMQKSLLEMYGEHEAKIRMIQRRPNPAPSLPVNNR